MVLGTHPALETTAWTWGKSYWRYPTVLRNKQLRGIIVQAEEDSSWRQHNTVVAPIVCCAISAGFKGQ